MMYDTFMTRTQIYLRDDQMDYLRQKAFEEKTTVSEIIRRIIAEYMIKDKSKKDPIGR